MGFVCYLQYFDRGNADGVPMETVRQAFGPHLVHAQSTRWCVEYDALNSCELLLATLAGHNLRIHCVTAQRPPEAGGFWDAMYELLGAGNAVFYGPDCAPMVAVATVEQHLPADMLLALGKPGVVMTSSELKAAFTGRR